MTGVALLSRLSSLMTSPSMMVASDQNVLRGNPRGVILTLIADAARLIVLALTPRALAPSRLATVLSTSPFSVR